MPEAAERACAKRRWLAIGVVGLTLTTGSVVADWRDDHAILINTTQSMPEWAFFIDRGRMPRRGDLVVFAPPDTSLIRAHFGQRGAPFAKRALGMPGDLIARHGQTVFINGAPVAQLKAHTTRGETLTPGPTGKVPQGCYYAGTAHKDGFDSRYAEIGFVCKRQIIGSGDAAL